MGSEDFATTFAKVVLFHHYCLAARTEFGEVLPHSGQGVPGHVDALTLTENVAGIGGDAVFQAGDNAFSLVVELVFRAPSSFVRRRSIFSLNLSLACLRLKGITKKPSMAMVLAVRTPVNPGWRRPRLW